MSPQITVRFQQILWASLFLIHNLTRLEKKTHIGTDLSAGEKEGNSGVRKAALISS